MYAHGSRKTSLLAKSCKALISSTGISAARPPNPTTRRTPRVATALPNAEELNWQKIYLGKSGSSTVTVRADHRRFCRYVGRKHAYPFWLSKRSTLFSFFGSVCRANHGVIVFI